MIMPVGVAVFGDRVHLRVGPVVVYLDPEQTRDLASRLFGAGSACGDIITAMGDVDPSNEERAGG